MGGGRQDDRASRLRSVEECSSMARVVPRAVTADERFALINTCKAISVFPLGDDARLWYRVSTMGVRDKWGSGIHCELFYVGRHIVFAVEHLVKRNFPT